MILYFANRAFTIEGLASTELDSKFVVVNDTKTESVSNHVSVFEADISFYDKDRSELEQLAAAGNYILRYVGGDADEPTAKRYSISKVTDIFTIIESEIDISGKRIYIYAEDLGLDLLNDLAPAYVSDGYVTINDCVNDLLTKSGFEVGVNEIPYLQNVVSLEETSTVTERLNTIASIFDCELSYSFDITGLRITHKYLDIRKRRGRDTHEILSIGKNLNDIRVKNSITGLATAIQVSGSDKTPLDIEYDDGDFYVANGTLYSRNALEKWHRYKNQSGHILRQFSYETSNMQDLLDKALEELKKIREPIANYEIDIALLPDGVGIGDIVYIVDDVGGLYVSGRILELKTSISTNTVTATVGDYKIKNSGISGKVIELAGQFSELASRRILYTWVVYADDENGTNASMVKGDRQYIAVLSNMVKELTSDEQLTPEVISKLDFQVMLYEQPSSIYLTSVGGTMFKNKAISTVINATVKAGDEYVSTIEELMKLYGRVKLVWHINESTLQDDDPRITRDGFTLTYKDTDGLDNVVITCDLVREV